MENQLTKIAEVKLSYITKVKASDRFQVSNSQDVYKLFLESWDQDTIEFVETCKLMLLNRSNRVLGIAHISQGGVSGTLTDVRVILLYALKTNASGIILCHNHPSGNLQPSESDLRITSKLKEVAMIHDINMLDHLIITNDGYYSLTNMGCI